MGHKQPYFGLRIIIALAAAAFVFGLPAAVQAACGNPNQQTCSANYGVSETAFGSGGQLCDPTAAAGQRGSSTNYCAKSMLGELGIGNTASTSFQTQAGFNTNREPSLTFAVNTSSVVLSPSSTITPGTTAYGTAAFAVETYLASGYTVVTSSPAPTNSTYTITVPGTQFTPNNTAEQFGINLKANSGCGGGMPASLGADPVQVPNNTFSFGAPTTNYGTACKFSYGNGDTIASASKSSGETDYTISYIINATNATPGGTYTMNQVLVATSTF